MLLIITLLRSFFHTQVHSPDSVISSQISYYKIKHCYLWLSCGLLRLNTILAIMMFLLIFGMQPSYWDILWPSSVLTLKVLSFYETLTYSQNTTWPNNPVDH